jgi:sugar lactone lactonase YvrE
MAEPRVILDDLVMGESVRWHDGSVWLCDWGAGQVIRVDDGRPAVVAEMQGLPFCIDWLPDGELVTTSGASAQLLHADHKMYADLAGVADPYPWNDIAIDARGNVFVNNIGYEFGVGETGPGLVAVVTPDRAVRAVAGDLLFPNGMVVAGETLVVAESHAGRLTAFDIAPDGSLNGRRVWAAVDGSAPDGICLGRDGTIWYADVPNQECVEVREGGAVVQRIGYDRGAFDCVLSPDNVLYAVVADYAAVFSGRHTGQLTAVALD